MKNKGILYAVIAYFLWGVFPIYWKSIHDVSAFQILGHRIVWSFAVLMVLVWLRKDWQKVKKAFTDQKTIKFFIIAAVLLAVNWVTYIWSVNNDHIVESSLGYFINPLVSVLLGVVFLNEKLRSMQWVAIGLAAAGVIYLTVQYGRLPWIALVLAFSFGFYGLFKKMAPLGALHGMTLEMSVLFLPALGYLLWVETQGIGAFGHVALGQNLLIVLAGAVTVAPILLFGSAARMIPLSSVGVLQYIAPTLQFLIGVLIYNEPFTHVQLIGFGIIWMALILYWVEGFLHRGKQLVSEKGK